MTKTDFLEKIMERGYANVSEKNKPALTLEPVEIQVDLDKKKFYRMFVSLMTAVTPAR
jgi:hypothetical protein